MAIKYDSLQNGDLIAWHRGPSGSSQFSYLSLVRLFTMFEFGHVSVVWKKNDDIHHVEAVIPKVHRVELPRISGLYALPINRVVTEEHMASFFEKQIGWKYSIRDATYGFLGMIPKEDDRVQCAEQATEFYKSIGIPLTNSYTPSRIVRRLMENENICLQKLIV